MINGATGMIRRRSRRVVSVSKPKKKFVAIKVNADIHICCLFVRVETEEETRQNQSLFWQLQ